MPKSIDLLTALRGYFRPEQIPFESETIGDKVIIDVCQGIGDIFWVYQKFINYFSEIQFRIWILKESPLDKRSAAWIGTFPGASFLGFKTVMDYEYKKLAMMFGSMSKAKHNWGCGDEVVYSCNRWLETGIRLDEIDPGSKVAWNVPLITNNFDIPFPEHMSFYVSGATVVPQLSTDKDLAVWSIENWVSYLSKVYEKYRVPFVGIGARYDEPIMRPIAEKLTEQGIPVFSAVQKSPPEVLHILKTSKAFLAYQSGLNILADNLGTPQMMMYFPFLDKMRETWCQREHIGTKFNHCLFNELPTNVADVDLFKK